jgi:hypothetical protein
MSQAVARADPRPAARRRKERSLFSSLAAENDMKWSTIYPEPDRYNYPSAVSPGCPMNHPIFSPGGPRPRLIRV